MKETISSPEKHGPGWELISGSRTDNEAIAALVEDEIGGKQEVIEHPAGSGLMLRDNKQPIGYALFSINDWDGKKVLYVEQLYIKEQNRNAALFADFITRLQAYGKQQNVDEVGWATGSPVMWFMSQMAGLESVSRIPLNEFDVPTLLKRVRDFQHSADASTLEKIRARSQHGPE
jgi:hypothetical protein